MPLIIMKEGMHQFNILIYSIIIFHFRLLSCINLAFLYLFECVIIKEEIIIFIIKPISSKL